MDLLFDELILYAKKTHYSILHNFSTACKAHKNNEDTKSIRININFQMSQLIEFAIDYGLSGNLWHGYIAYIIATDENAFSRMCERRLIENVSICEFARFDLDKLFELFNYDFTELKDYIDSSIVLHVFNYKALDNDSFIRYKNVSLLINELTNKLNKAKTKEDFYNAVVNFYFRYGYGELGLNKAFRVACGECLKLSAVNDMESVHLDNIVGYDSQKKALLDNTIAFVNGNVANNVLLYGDSGTGKSTSIKAIINEFYDDGLRMIEIHKHQIENLSEIISTLKYRNYRFVIYMDDLSFEENENEYKYLKAIIEGGVETKPDNVLIYATSNRRHLIRETWNDREGLSARNDVHSSDTIEEKLSLAARFGLTIYYPKPARSQYTEIVKELAKRAGINISDEELENKARVWEMHHGGVSGRTARQFITNLLSEQ